MAGKTGVPGGGLWPAALLPLGLTAIFIAVFWLYTAKIEADQKLVLDEAGHLDSHAKVEARDIASAARASALTYVASKRDGRKVREERLRVEAKGILDSVFNLLSASLDKTRKTGPQRRNVGSFPSGFNGLGDYLQYASPAATNDPAVDALQANTPEIVSLLGSGCSLAIIEDSAREIYSHGGGATLENSISVSLSRDFIFKDNDSTRHWSLLLRLAVPESQASPTAKDTAEFIARDLGARQLPGALWGGWLIAPTGDVAAAFSAATGQATQTPPFINIPGQWVDYEGERRVWLERSGGMEGLPWEVAVSVAIPRAPLVRDWWSALQDDSRWGATLGTLFLVVVAGWLWFAYNQILALPAVVPVSTAPGPRSPHPTRFAEAAAPQRRLVRDPARERVIPDAPGVIMADIAETVEVRLERVAAERPAMPAAPAPKPQPIPSGSLLRLQSIHRGGEGGMGSRVLDQARSQVLKELANRVRPVVVSQFGVGKQVSRRIGDALKKKEG